MFVRSLLSALACVLAVGQLAASAPHADPIGGASPAHGHDLDLRDDHGLDLHDDQVLEKRAVDMVLWAGSVANGDATWQKKLPSPFSTKATAKALAKEGYESVIAKSDARHKTDVQLVAALFVASGPGRGIYLASIPKDPTWPRMTVADAPDWAAAIAPRRTKYHAEDGAMWLFESSLAADKKLCAGTAYPAGSTMYVYGHFKDDDGNPLPPAYRNPCVSRDPSCSTVLGRLDIATS